LAECYSHWEDVIGSYVSCATTHVAEIRYAVKRVESSILLELTLAPLTYLGFALGAENQQGLLIPVGVVAVSWGVVFFPGDQGTDTSTTLAVEHVVHANSIHTTFPLNGVVGNLLVYFRNAGVPRNIREVPE
jgi:hypothetical protein